MGHGLKCKCKTLKLLGKKYKRTTLGSGAKQTVLRLDTKSTIHNKNQLLISLVPCVRHC